MFYLLSFIKQMKLDCYKYHVCDRYQRISKTKNNTSRNLDEVNLERQCLACFVGFEKARLHHVGQSPEGVQGSHCWLLAALQSRSNGIFQIYYPPLRTFTWLWHFLENPLASTFDRVSPSLSLECSCFSTGTGMTLLCEIGSYFPKHLSLGAAAPHQHPWRWHTLPWVFIQVFSHLPGDVFTPASTCQWPTSYQSSSPHIAREAQVPCCPYWSYSLQFPQNAFCWLPCPPVAGVTHHLCELDLLSTRSHSWHLTTFTLPRYSYHHLTMASGRPVHVPPPPTLESKIMDPYVTTPRKSPLAFYFTWAMLCEWFHMLSFGSPRSILLWAFSYVTEISPFYIFYGHIIFYHNSLSIFGHLNFFLLL